MVRFYYIQVKLGKMTIDEVPAKYRKAVQEMLDND